VRVRSQTFASLLLVSLFSFATGCASREARGRTAAVDCQPTVGQESREAHYALPGLGHGLVQSPVNILSDRAVDGSHLVATHFDHADPSSLNNTGRTIEIEFPIGPSCTYDGRDYSLKQLHFHTPSEHQIDGVTFPMELHIVNLIEPENPEEPPVYLVIAILFRMGETNEFIASFLDKVPLVEGEEDLEAGQVYLDGLDLDPIPEYFHYRGSLTTPPHTETVDWLVLKKIMQASPVQIWRVNRIEGDNARHIQALYDRSIDD